MELCIANKRPANFEGYFVPHNWLESKPVHLYIASNEWDALRVEVSDEIPDGVLKYIRMKCKEIFIILPFYNITDKKIRLLCELYPEKAALIRKTYFMHGDVVELLPSC